MTSVADRERRLHARASSAGGGAGGRMMQEPEQQRDGQQGQQARQAPHDKDLCTGIGGGATAPGATAGRARAWPTAVKCNRGVMHVTARRVRTDSDQSSNSVTSAVGTANGRRRGRVEPEVPPGGRGGDPAARRAGQQPDAHQERLGDLLDRLPLLAHRDRQRGDARPARRRSGGTARRARPGRAGRGRTRRPRRGRARPGAHVEGDHAVGAHLGVVADPAQQPVGDARRAAGARGDLGGARRRSASTPSSPAERRTIRSSSAARRTPGAR